MALVVKRVWGGFPDASTLVPAGGDLVDMTSADQWFSALDQRRVDAGTASWVVQVHGVHRENDRFWIQISSTDDPFATIVLHLAASTRIEDVLRALEGHDRRHDGRPSVIDLAAKAEPLPLTSAAVSSILYPQRPH